jgi:hypothetical protein
LYILIFMYLWECRKTDTKQNGSQHSQNLIYS